MRHLQILSKIFDILATYSQDDLKKAGAVYPHTELADAIASLARAQRQMGSTSTPPRDDITEQQLGSYVRVSDNVQSTRSELTKEALASIRMLFATPGVFGTAAELADFLRRLGLGVSFRPRDGRLRNERKLISILNSLPDERRRVVMQQLIDGVSQTSGWFDLIRRKGRR